MSIDINYIKHNFFYFDEPVPYQLDDEHEIKIYPISVRDSETFMFCKDVIDQDKNSIPDIKIIQMSYLQYIIEYLFKNPVNVSKLLIILQKCLLFTDPAIGYHKKDEPIIVDKETGAMINSKNFDDIRKVILYQNIAEYDDEYINPELKKNIEEAQYLKSKNIELPSLERKIAIITSHTGISKEEQLKMTYRSHSLLFNEVREETDYLSMYALAMMFGDKKHKPDAWIYKFKKEKFADQTMSVAQYNQQAGGDGKVTQKIINNN